jgi:hypothetical protein
MSSSSDNSSSSVCPNSFPSDCMNVFFPVWGSISPTFYVELLCVLVSRAAFFCLCFRFVLYWSKTVGATAVCRTLMKLNPAFVPKLIISLNEKPLKNQGEKEEGRKVLIYMSPHQLLLLVRASSRNFACCEM